MAIDSSVQKFLNLTNDICRNIGHRESPLHPHESEASLGARKQALLELVKQLGGLRAVWEAAVGSAPHLSCEVIGLRDAVVDAIHCHGRLQRVADAYTALEVAAYQSNQSNGKPNVESGKRGRPPGSTSTGTKREEIIAAIGRGETDDGSIALRVDTQPEYVARIRKQLAAKRTPK